MDSVILGSSYHADVCSDVHYSDPLIGYLMSHKWGKHDRQLSSTLIQPGDCMDKNRAPHPSKVSYSWL